MHSASELARREEEARPPVENPLEAYRLLRDRADRLGFPTVNHALDKLEELING